MIYWSGMIDLKYGRMKKNMRQKRIVSGAVVMALGLMLAGCSGGKASFSEAPQTEFKELRDESFAADMTGAEIPVLDLEKPIDFCYSSPEAEMLFKMEDGVWMDATDKEIPIDQERFQAMADVFLNLHAVSEVENAGIWTSMGWMMRITPFISQTGKRAKNIFSSVMRIRMEIII